MMIYELDFGRCREHLVDVHLRFLATQEREMLWLPTWIAGSYLVREFAKNITAVHYEVAHARHVATKSAKNTFVLDGLLVGEWVSVRYEVYCHDLSVRTAFVNRERIFGNFTSLLLMRSGFEREHCQINLHLPQSFLDSNPNTVLACGLAHQIMPTKTGLVYQLQQLPAFDSYDYPFEIGSQSYFEFTINTQGKDIAHRFFVAGRHWANLDRLKNDVQKICQSYANWLGGVPFADYTFMTMVTDKDYGGLEHINSTALISPRDDLPSLDEPALPSASYQRFLGLCSHEYFHAWWVKTVRPDVMVHQDLQQEAYTPLLWVFEGFTSYLDDLMLVRAQVIDKKSYLALLTDQINRHYQTDGRAFQSVAQSSFDTWIKLYRPDENTKNQSVSYYNTGALVALCLDLSLMSVGKRLFDVVRAFYDKSKTCKHGVLGIGTQQLHQVIGELLGDAYWQEFYESHVVGVKELPIVQLLSQAGVTIKSQTTSKIWGMTTEETLQGLKITHIQRQSRASMVGLSVGDVIVAIDGIKATNAWLAKSHQRHQASQATAQVHAFCRDELYVVDVPHGDDKTMTQLQLVDYTPSGWLEFE